MAKLKFCCPVLSVRTVLTLGVWWAEIRTARSAFRRFLFFFWNKAMLMISTFVLFELPRARENPIPHASATLNVGHLGHHRARHIQENVWSSERSAVEEHCQTDFCRDSSKEFHWMVTSGGQLICHQSQNNVTWIKSPPPFHLSRDRQRHYVPTQERLLINASLLLNILYYALGAKSQARISLLKTGFWTWENMDGRFRLRIRFLVKCFRGFGFG